MILFQIFNENNVVTEFGFDRPDHRAFAGRESSSLKFRNHLPFAKPAEVAAFGFGGALGESFSEIGEVFTFFNAGHNVFRIFFGADENVGSVNLFYHKLADVHESIYIVLCTAQVFSLPC